MGNRVAQTYIFLKKKVSFLYSFRLYNISRNSISFFLPCPCNLMCNLPSLLLEISIQLFFFPFLFSSFLLLFLASFFQTNVYRWSFTWFLGTASLFWSSVLLSVLWSISAKQQPPFQAFGDYSDRTNFIRCRHHPRVPQCSSFSQVSIYLSLYFLCFSLCWPLGKPRPLYCKFSFLWFITRFGLPVRIWKSLSSSKCWKQYNYSPSSPPPKPDFVI